MESEFCKLEIFLPESHLEAVQQALWSVDALFGQKGDTGSAS